jgi:lipopolysaccharide transport system permease protein
VTASLVREFGRISPQVIWQHRSLLRQLAWRDIIARYQGSALGLLWSLLTPLVMLGVFTFVFTVIFQVRWGTITDSKGAFALMLFPGVIVNAFFSECVNRAPGLVLQHPNYVKKVVFPLEILPCVSMLSALFHLAASVVALLAFELVVMGAIPLTALWLPVVIAPFLVLVLGVTWLLASLGVYLRDLPQLTALVTTVLMFMSPVFYPASAIPVEFRHWLALSPMTLPIEELRAILIRGEAPDFAALGVYAVVAVAFYAAGLYWFQRTRRGFADVL